VALMNLPDFLVTKLDYVANLARKHSLWPMPFATACCGIELMATAASRYDIARFGSEAMRFSPRQCDLMIVAGRVVMKMVPVMQRIWQQMPEPKWCISMGACASSGGVFDTYCTVQYVSNTPPDDAHAPIEMHHFGSGIWSQMRCSTGTIFITTRPATIIMSHCRGLNRIASEPNRAMS
jgi:NADH-quinone oxidoreductase subunit B